jgi:hypothetical protein
MIEYEQMHNMEIMNSCHFKINLKCFFEIVLAWVFYIND